ncbi:MAG: sensor histidine kinase [Chloroflexota bacterium]
MIQTDAPAKVKEYLEIIAGETRRSDKIVTDLLEFTRTRAAAREAVPLAPLIGKVIARYPLPEGLALQLDLPENLPLIYVDPRQMEQVLGNLVTNGFQAVTARTDLPPGQGALRISAVPNGEHIQIQVQDNGVGISAENLARIFEPLFTTKTRGFGLGLTVCQKLVEANAGAIRAESRPGEGSCFTIELPISKERP